MVTNGTRINTTENTTKMKKMIWMGLSVAVLAFTQCTKNEEAVVSPEGAANFELQAEVVEGRTVAEGMSTQWAADDAMKVWYGEGSTYTNCGEFTLPEDKVAAGLFSGTLPAEYDATKAYDWYAVYPYSTAANENGGTPELLDKAIGTNIQCQTGGYNSIAHISGSVAPLYGVAKGVEAGARPQLQMKHLTTLVKIVVTNLDEEALEVKNITVETEKTAIAGRARIAFADGVATYDPIANAANIALLRVTSNEETIAQNGKAEFYMALIPFTAPAEGEKLTVSVLAVNGEVCTRTFTIPARTEFKAGELNTLNLKYEATKVTDLSAEGTANCYIVTGAGDYKFKATKGNSDEKPELSTADWLWMSESGDLISDVRVIDGYVYFKAGSKKGNAVIASLTAKEAISWSWHIWLTDDPRINLHYGMTTDWSILDRNLGATSVTPDDYKSYGLYYQWGRKDPFVGTNTSGTKVKREEEVAFTDATATYVINPARNIDFSQVRSSNVPSGGEIAWSIANPMAYSFYYTNTDANVAGQNWWNSTYADFIGLWGFVKEGQPVNKTMYDPCPAGYAVPSFANTVYDGISASNLTVPTGSSLFGFNFTGAGGTTSYYPAAGSRQGYLSYLGLQALYWSAHNNASGRNFRAFYVNLADAKVNMNNKLSGYYALPVRCVKYNQPAE